MPTVSVVIPVYNGENYLEEALRSALEQSYRDFEVVVVDDGSTDGTWALIERYMAQYPGVVRGLRKTNGGTVTALNAGIEAAQGKYFAWLSHDDLFLPHKLEVQMKALENDPNIVGVYSDYLLIDASGKYISHVYTPWYPPRQMLRHFIQRPFINGIALVVERRCLQELGLFDAGLRYAHDAMMWADLIMHYQLGHIAEPVASTRIHPLQGSNKGAAIRRDGELLMEKILQRYPIQQIFPELDTANVDPANVAAAYNYLGDVLATIHPRKYALAFRQYWRGWQAWPSVQNPVLRKAFIAAMRSTVGTQRGKLRQMLRGGPLNERTFPAKLDLNEGAAPVPTVKF